MNIRTLHDINGANNDKPAGATHSFAGGERSGLAIENPQGNSSRRIEIPPTAKKLTIYKNGFTVDGDEFRSLENPDNVKMLNLIKKGYAPKELQGGNRRGTVQVAVIDKGNEEYAGSGSSKKVEEKLFTGEGFRLSDNGRPEEVASSSSAVIAPPQQRIQPDSSILRVDSRRPLTTLSIRFHDGTTVRQQFNTDHRLADLHNFLIRSAPTASHYRLLAGFPPREIAGHLQDTLHSLGLIDVAITQRLC